ncbi:hypothetical protein HOK51_02585 [Candidatus Woesearchaeota archaeon]|jgi:hypothetical protein|nr:hypothetical protein [Candidatus Woesearchaeota archaeon]MBT6518705.1 hypothetical protein [Candidatus Woesearchaeota archaeon]MBT7368373.1 hypothetical protein [Candidatus Woesearchaeota archaeon]
MSRLSDYLIGIGVSVNAGGCGIDFAYSLAIYRSQTDSITQKVYSAANTINPDVVQKANDMVAQFADKPDYFNGITAVVSGAVALAVLVKAANKQNYD